MGNELFGVDIAGLISDNVGDGLLDVGLETSTPGGRVAGSLTKGRASTNQTYTCKGFWKDYTSYQADGDQIHADDRQAVLIGDSIPAGVALKRGDVITIEGLSLPIIRPQSRDPAAAVFIYQCGDRLGADGQ